MVTLTLAGLFRLLRGCERLYPVELESMPHEVPDRFLRVQIDPQIDQPFYALSVGGCQGHAVTFLIGFFGQLCFSPLPPFLFIPKGAFRFPCAPMGAHGFF